MCSQTAHGMKRHRVTGHRFVAFAPTICPGDGQFNLLVPRGDAHFMRQAAYGGRRDAGDAFSPFGCVGLDAFLQ